MLRKRCSYRRAGPISLLMCGKAGTSWWANEARGKSGNVTGGDDSDVTRMMRIPKSRGSLPIFIMDGEKRTVFLSRDGNDSGL